jgi:hypothetical protein
MKVFACRAYPPLSHGSVNENTAHPPYWLDYSYLEHLLIVIRNPVYTRECLSALLKTESTGCAVTVVAKKPLSFPTPPPPPRSIAEREDRFCHCETSQGSKQSSRRLNVIASAAKQSPRRLLEQLASLRIERSFAHRPGVLPGMTYSCHCERSEAISTLALKPDCFTSHRTLVRNDNTFSIPTPPVHRVGGVGIDISCHAVEPTTRSGTGG